MNIKKPYTFEQYKTKKEIETSINNLKVFNRNSRLDFKYNDNDSSYFSYNSKNGILCVNCYLVFNLTKQEILTIIINTLQKKYNITINQIIGYDAAE